MDTMHYDADCGIEDADGTNATLDSVEVNLGLREDPNTGLLTYDGDVVTEVEETDEGWIYYV